MLSIFVFIAVLIFLVVVHEFGHFGMAKLLGVRVLEFGIGFPPRLFGIKYRGTVYSLNIMPLGGFVRLEGEEDPHASGGLANRSAKVRLSVLAAGSLMNFLLPIFLLTIFFMTPKSVPITDVVILKVSADSPAQEANILPGDLIREVDGREIRNSGDLRSAIQLRIGAKSNWVIERSGRLVEMSLIPRVKPPNGEGSVGILPIDARVSIKSVEPSSSGNWIGLRRGDLLVTVGTNAVLFEENLSLAIESTRENAPGKPLSVLVLRNGALVDLKIPWEEPELTGIEVFVEPDMVTSKPLWQAFPASLAQMSDILIMFRNEVSRWVSGVRPEVTGPIGIAQLTGEVARSGLSPLLFWMALLSMNLAIINLLPIPALDGGRITFVLLELVRGGRRLSPQRERFVHFAGFIALMALILMVSFNDLRRIVSGESIVGP